jgi:hypothetical protein
MLLGDRPNLAAVDASADGWRLSERALPFLRAGASAVIAPWWPTVDRADQVFWASFYELLSGGGVRLGEAVWRARLAVRRALPERPDWLAYTLFGDPRARPYWPAASEGYTAIECLNPDRPLRPGTTYYFRASIRRRPPVWHQDRLVQAEDLPRAPRAVFRAAGCQLTTSEPIDMTPEGPGMVQAIVGATPQSAGETMLTVRLLDGDERLQLLQIPLLVGDNGDMP